jgi:formylglycine-generating enzyme
MKKQFKLGMVLASWMGVVLCGAANPDGVRAAHASEAAALGPETSDVEEGGGAGAKLADALTLANLGVKPASHAAESTPSLSCPDGMVEVEGDYCPSVEERCVRWLDPETKQRCAEFDPATTCLGHTVHKHFCIDRFEYPNVAGQKPTVMKDWYEAKATCQGEGKRLCGDSEWTLACEGEQRFPYPYGYERSADACNIDKPHLDVDEKAMADESKRDAEVARLDQRSASGEHQACVSPYGAYDMTGNVDEWVVNESAKPYKSGLKGGYWGPVRDRCRPMTIAHNEEFQFYQIGFRCCGDPGQGGPKASVGASAHPGPSSQGMLAGS